MLFEALGSALIGLVLAWAAHHRLSHRLPARSLVLATGVAGGLFGAFVFLIFIVIPGGDPAVRIAGRTANDQNIANIRKTWGFDEPFYVQYVDMMKKAANGLRPGCCEGQQSELRSQTNQLNVVDQIRAGVPARTMDNSW